MGDEMSKFIAAIAAGGLLLATPSVVAAETDHWLGVGARGEQARELALYLAGFAAVVAVLIAVSGGKRDEEPVSP